MIDRRAFLQAAIQFAIITPFVPNNLLTNDNENIGDVYLEGFIGWEETGFAIISIRRWGVNEVDEKTRHEILLGGFNGTP